MACNVVAWKKAKQLGYELSQYAYDQIPAGEWVARLDVKVWAQKVLAVNCYFTLTEKPLQVQLSVYCNPAGRYQLPDGLTDFATCPLGVLYRVRVIATQKEKKVITGAWRV
jgi:hypothetical protein